MWGKNAAGIPQESFFFSPANKRKKKQQPRAVGERDAGRIRRRTSASTTVVEKGTLLVTLGEGFLVRITRDLGAGELKASGQASFLGRGGEKSKMPAGQRALTAQRQLEEEEGEGGTGEILHHRALKPPDNSYNSRFYTVFLCWFFFEPDRAQGLFHLHPWGGV